MPKQILLAPLTKRINPRRACAARVTDLRPYFFEIVSDSLRSEVGYKHISTSSTGEGWMGCRTDVRTAP